MAFQYGSTSRDKNQVSVNNLIELLPPTLDNPMALSSFIKQVDSVFNLADPTQTPGLLLFVRQRVGIKAKELLDTLPEFPKTWPELANILIHVYRDKRPMYQVTEELNAAKYEKGESVQEFYQRLKKLEATVIQTIHARYSRDVTLTGRIATINELTLYRFVYHSHPAVSRVLKYNTHDNITKAFAAALRVEEESTGLCDICYRRNHKTSDCFQNSRYKKSDNDSKYCDFCKRAGHATEVCWRKDQKPPSTTEILEF